MAISENDVLKVAQLARIGLSDEELKLFSGQLETIIEFIDRLKEVDITFIKSTSHVLDMHTVVRPDAAKGSLAKESVLRNAPETAKGHFKVPKVIE